MKIRFLRSLILCSTLCCFNLSAQNRYIVRVAGGLPILSPICRLLACNVASGLDGVLGQVFLVTTAPGGDPNTFLTSILRQIGVIDAEIDQVATTLDAHTAAPPALLDSTPVPYYGATVIDGYVHQPATALIQLQQAQNQFNISGTGVVAVIDTGVDPNHPVLRNVLLPGYNAINNSPIADETLDVLLPSAPVTTGMQANSTNNHSTALVDQSTAAVIDGNPGYSDFGHGTMVSGIIHLTAPQTKILPIKAFQANGTGYNSDIIRGVYYAIEQNVSVINMSFNLASYSQELRYAVITADFFGIVSVASAGNQGNAVLLYPASYPEVVSVASTSNADQLSTFSSYGPTVWLSAPGEGVVTTYPFGTYAAAWGTSFSAPFVSGTAALFRSVQFFCNQHQSAQALSHADPVNAPIGNGRLNILNAVQAVGQNLDIHLF